VQIAWTILDKDLKEIKSENFIVKPEGFEIPKESSDIHRVTQEKALREGQPLREVIQVLNKELESCPSMVAHNIDFDSKVIAAEMHRLQEFPKLSEKLNKICTMKATTDLVGLPSPYGSGFKWPKLEELYYFLFKEKFEDAHDASVDVKALVACYVELNKMSFWNW
jgi:DNA polymerase III epsilon subunit-like protein